MSVAGHPKPGKLTGRMILVILNPGAVLLASVVPALVGVLLAVDQLGRVPVPLVVILVLIPTLLNAAVNLLDDYYDYKRGTDGAGIGLTAEDAPLAYYQVEESKPVQLLGFGFFALAALLGLYVVWACGPVPAVIGGIGAAIAVSYSGGSIPLSHLPVGEVIAGVTHGGLIPLGVYAALTGEAPVWNLYLTMPLILLVGQIMLVNNTCDIERDQKAGRRTLPILIGRDRARKLAAVLTVIWLLQLIQVVATWYTKGLPLLLLILLLGRKSFLNSVRAARTAETRQASVEAVALAVLVVTAGYFLAVLLDVLLS